jgi:hypothetical protein
MLKNRLTKNIGYEIITEKYCRRLEMITKYAKNEKDKLNELKSLLESWKNKVSIEKVKSGTKNYTGKDLFVEDGFFPNYFNQKYKVLFIAREEVGDGWAIGKKEFKVVNDWLKLFNNEDGLDARYGLLGSLLILLYGIENGFQDKYDDIKTKEKITEIARSIGKHKGLSFSIMELSKYYNANGTKGVNKKLMTQFLEHSQLNWDKNNFFKDEISILTPDIIITLRLWKLNKKITEYINELIFDKKILKFNFIKRYGKKDKWNCITLNSIILKRKKIPIIDMGHFSTPGKSIKNDFYNPLMRIFMSDNFKENFPKLKFGEEKIKKNL